MSRNSLGEEQRPGPRLVAKTLSGLESDAVSQEASQEEGGQAGQQGRQATGRGKGEAASGERGQQESR